MGNTEFITVTNDFNSQEFPDSTHDIITVIIGDLADRLRARHDMTGEVRIHQHGDEGGYSEYTVEWDWSAWITIGGVKVGPEGEGYSEVDDWQYEINSGSRGWSANDISKYLLEVGAE